MPLYAITLHSLDSSAPCLNTGEKKKNLRRNYETYSCYEEENKNYNFFKVGAFPFALNCFMSYLFRKKNTNKHVFPICLFSFALQSRMQVLL